METNGENVELNHPDHDDNKKCLEFLRVSYEGQTAVLATALQSGFIKPPQGMIGYTGPKTPMYHMVQSNIEAYEYIERSRYPEVLRYAVAMAVGKAWSRPPTIKGDGVKNILDTLFADGSDFRTGVLNALTDYLLTGGGGFFVNLNEAGQAVIYHNPPESVCNWSFNQSALRLVVFETETESDNPFSHEMVTQRVIAGIDQDSGQYFLEKWNMVPTTNENGGSGGDAWLQEDERVYPTFQQSHLKSIPYFIIGDWKLNPIFKALAETAKTYCRAYAEYAHSMYWSAIPQPVIVFGEHGDFYGNDDFDPESVGDDAAGFEPPEIKFGCTTPILLRDAELKFVSAPTGALSALKERVKDLREEIGSLGARAFANTTNANQTAETERLQNSGEGSLIHSAYRELAAAITIAVRTAAQQRGVRDAGDFLFEFDGNILFDDFSLSDINFLQALHTDGYIARRHVRDQLRRQSVIEPDITEEKLDEEIAGERGLGGGFGDDEFDPLSDDFDDLKLGVDDDEDDSATA